MVTTIGSTSPEVRVFPVEITFTEVCSDSYEYLQTAMVVVAITTCHIWTCFSNLWYIRECYVGMIRLLHKKPFKLSHFADALSTPKCSIMV